MVRCFFCPPIIITHIHLTDASDPSCRRLSRTGIHPGRSRFSRTHGAPAVGTAVVVLLARRPALRLGLSPRNFRQQAHDVRSCDFFLKRFSCASSHVINVEERRHQEDLLLCVLLSFSVEASANVVDYSLCAAATFS